MFLSSNLLSILLVARLFQVGAAREPQCQAVVLPDMDFTGDDLMHIARIDQSVCCETCYNYAQCTAYTFVENENGTSLCYLKSGSDNRKPKEGAISAIVNKNMTSSCPNVLGGTCADETHCCQQGYCFPNGNIIFSCLLPPAKCSSQMTNYDLPGNDLQQAMYGISPDTCCDVCASTSGCVAYTYVTGETGCYLKKSLGEKVWKVGAVTGFVTATPPVMENPSLQ
ncbi:unnamed protein product [Albugo candida]|uniref:Apple domain-containing protein n=1 Tax=Albugo candida TaxID=65357 RepID=A0A024GTY2_9STRA|nr:unnamed protein product [Albugo candida]|eukprot:CCI50402.1 unnamed protein product [Albugo candida]